MYRALPQWQTLPQIDLYLDQVLIYVNQTLNTCLTTQKTYLTASMVNNYVKLGLIPKANKKRYQPSHLACLIPISLFKTCFAIQDISAAIQSLLEQYKGPYLYDYFTQSFERILVEDQLPDQLETPQQLIIIQSACLTLKHHALTHHYLQTLQTEEAHHEPHI